MSVIKLTKSNYSSEVTASEKPVLIDFYAAWCGSCKAISPIVDEIAEENSSFKVCKVDVDSEPQLAQDFGISSIPTLVVIKGGKVAAQAAGARSKQAILAMVQG